jgi:hypothetical protein
VEKNAQRIKESLHNALVPQLELFPLATEVFPRNENESELKPAPVLVKASTSCVKVLSIPVRGFAIRCLIGKLRCLNGREQINGKIDESNHAKRYHGDVTSDSDIPESMNRWGSKQFEVQHGWSKDEQAFSSEHRTPLGFFFRHTLVK